MCGEFILLYLWEGEEGWGDFVLEDMWLSCDYINWYGVFVFCKFVFWCIVNELLLIGISLEFIDFV